MLWFTGWTLEWHATCFSNVNVCFFYQINEFSVLDSFPVHSLYISVRCRRILLTDAAVLQLWHQFKVHPNLCVIRYLLSSLYHLLLLLTSQLPLVLTEVDAQWSARGDGARCVHGGWKFAYMLCRLENSSSNVFCKYLTYTERERDDGVDELFKESGSDICTVSSTDYFTSVSLCIGFYILFHISSCEKEAKRLYNSF